jgi:hypothetical protein
VHVKPLGPVLAALVVAGSTIPSVAQAAWTVTDTSGLGPQPALVLAQNLAGPGIVVTSATYVGAPRAAGVFTADPAVIGFGDGIILSTGDIRNVVDQNSGTTFDWPPDSPNSSTTLISTQNGTAGDADLEALAGNETHDAASLEIKFVPAQPFVQIQYVFASDEYNEYVGTGVNDLFAFFLNGSNVALLPDSTVAVGIETVNAGQHPQYFIDNTDRHLDTEMDGLTVVLTVQAAVQAGVVNTLRIAIADVYDDLGDSNVFLQGASFTSIATVTDTDGDGVPDFIDNCPDVPNPTQADSNFNGIGDACDTAPPPPPQPLAFEKMTGGGAVEAAQPGSEGVFGFNLRHQGDGLQVNLEYGDRTKKSQQEANSVAQIKIKTLVTEFTGFQTINGPGVQFTAPCLVRTRGPAKGRELDTCSLLIADDGEPGAGSLKKGTLADRFKISVVSGPSAGYASGSPAILRGNIQAH